MGVEEEMRRLGFQTRLKIFKERDKPKGQQDPGALEDWRAILEDLDKDKGRLSNLLTRRMSLFCLSVVSIFPQKRL